MINNNIMELLKTEYSETKGNDKLDKVLLNCNESNYYKLTEFLYTSQNYQALILKALYECDLNIVLKFGILESIQKEYNISNELINLPNFIRYFCLIECNDSIKNIINHKETIMNYKMCHYGNNLIGILVMKYYNLGCIENYDWNENNFEILKNVIKQVIYAIINAYNKIGFLHGDLHTGNILLKPKRKNKIKYEEKILLINEFEVVIMDFEKSKINQINKIYNLLRNIHMFLTSIIITCNKKGFILDIDLKKITKLKSFDELNINYYDIIEKIIDDIYLSHF